MCGIAGEVRADSSWTDEALRRLRHRGPDATTARGRRFATLGCTRLAIRGGPAGDQPLATRRGVLVFNGEIYNTAELVAELSGHGVAVDGASDTSVVGALLDVHGIRAVDKLNGMFALAWQEGDTAVWLARDPAGIKPLYYRGARFCSEIRPLLDDGAALDADALGAWLTFHVTPGPRTLFRDVRRVPPGGIVRLPDGAVVRSGAPALVFGASNPGATPERIGKVLRRAVRDATPPGRFGVTLSGGLDSSLILALAREAAPLAFHGRVDAPGCDESPHARAVAAELGVAMIEVPVTAGACLDAWPRVVAALEEPVAGPGALAQWVVAERAARDVRVLLSGCGGDELFGGYARAVALVRDRPPGGLEAYAPLFERVAGLAAGPRAFALLDRRARGLFAPDFLAAHPEPRDAFLARFREGDLEPLAAAARAEIEIVLPGLLQVEDRITMAFGVEGRVPLLDRRLLRTAMRLAPEARVDAAGRAKALLKDAAAPFLPAAARARSDKMGFPLPLRDWFAGPWRAFARDVLLQKTTRERGMIDPAGAEAALGGGGRFDRGLYAAVSLELWCRMFLDG